MIAVIRKRKAEERESSAADARLGMWPWSAASAPSAAAPTPILRIDSAAHMQPIRDAAASNKYSMTLGDDWTLLWTFRTPWTTEALKKRLLQKRPFSHRPFLVNHLAGTLRVASKEHLPEFLRTAGLTDAAPATFRLPEDMELARAALTRDPLHDASGLPTWMLKSKQHRNIRPLLNSTSEHLASQSPALLQRRVRPLLLPGLHRAFDIGIYVLVSSVSPLRIYAYEKALVRVCEKPFPTSAAGFASSADRSAYVINHYSPLWSLPFFAPFFAQCPGHTDAACALRAALSAHGHDGAQLWRKMEAVVSRALTHLKPHAEEGLHRIGLSPAHAFELFRFDFMVDERAQPMLTEVNISPNMVAAHDEDGKVKAALLRDTLRIVSTRLRTMKATAASSAGAAATREAAVAGGFRRIGRSKGRGRSA